MRMARGISLAEAMFVMACLKHWYMSMIFFGPVPLVGLWIWFSGRRKTEASSGSA